MKIKYAETTFTGTAKEIVRGMKNSNMFTAEEIKTTYMNDVAVRLDALKGITVRSDTALHFLKDLVENGLASRVQ